MSKEENYIMDLTKFAISETINNLKGNKNRDPSLKAVEDIVTRYGVNKEGSWFLYRPIFWYLSNQKVISVDQSGWSLHPDYQNPSEATLDALVKGVLQSYKDTLYARLEKYHNDYNTIGMTEGLPDLKRKI